MALLLSQAAAFGTPGVHEKTVPLQGLCVPATQDGPHLEFAFHNVFDCVCTLHLALIGNGSGEGQVLPRKDCFCLRLFEDLVEMWYLAGCWKRKVIK